MTETMAERRRSTRLVLDVGLVVRSELVGRADPFREETFTVSVSKHGALVLLASKVEIGQVLFLANPATQREVRGKVVRVGGAHGGLRLVGVEFDESSTEFWPWPG